MCVECPNFQPGIRVGKTLGSQVRTWISWGRFSHIVLERDRDPNPVMISVDRVVMLIYMKVGARCQ